MLNEIIEFIKVLMSFPTTDDLQAEVNQCFKEIKNRFKEQFILKEYRFRRRNMLVLSNTESKKLDLILAGHIDVVPTYGKGGYSLKEKGDRLYGRGVFDMKGPLAVCLFALKSYLSNDKKKPRLKIALLITADEELDGLSTRYLIDKIGYRAKFAIIPDGGSESEVVIAQKGFWQFKLTIGGKTAHAAYPFKADNQIEKIFFFYDQLLKQFPPPQNAEDWKTSIVLTKIVSGEAINKIPGEATAYFDVRYVDKKDQSVILRKIHKLPKKKFKYEIVAENNLTWVDEKLDFIVRLKKTIETVSGKVSFVKTCGTSDAVFLADKDIPTVLFSPDGCGAHQEREWVDKKSLKNFYKILVTFLEKIS